VSLIRPAAARLTRNWPGGNLVAGRASGMVIELSPRVAGQASGTTMTMGFDADQPSVISACDRTRITRWSYLVGSESLRESAASAELSWKDWSRVLNHGRWRPATWRRSEAGSRLGRRFVGTVFA
jgi:hypothetical protein